MLFRPLQLLCCAYGRVAYVYARVPHADRILPSPRSLLLQFTVVGYHGTGLIPYSQALGAVFLEGIIFMILSLCGLRQWIARLLPHSLKLATGAGIGLYLAFIGLGPSGLSVIGGNTSDLVGLGGCKPEYQDENGFCQSHVLQDPRGVCSNACFPFV